MVQGEEVGQSQDEKDAEGDAGRVDEVVGDVRFERFRVVGVRVRNLWNGAAQE
jgi:hypothetical protein